MPKHDAIQVFARPLLPFVPTIAFPRSETYVLRSVSRGFDRR